jgi:hypothetical protein
MHLDSVAAAATPTDVSCAPQRPDQRREFVVITVVLLALAIGSAVAQHRDGFDRWKAAAGGHATTRVSAFRLPGGRYEFRAYLDEDGMPNVVYFVPGHGGGSRLTFVGDRGGWAVEPRVLRAGDHDIVYGATIPDVATVRVPTGTDATTTATLHVTDGPFRYFVLVTHRGQHVQRTNDIAALDRDGNLLGRPHDNYGTADAPDFGTYEGLWDRNHVPDLPTG